MTTKTIRPLLSCDGFRIGAFAVPEFTVHPGEVAQLAFNENTFESGDVFDELLEKFQAPTPGGPISSKSVVVARPAMPLRQWRTMFRSQTLLYWLSKNTELSQQEAGRQISAAGLKPDMPFAHAAGNPRTALGILAALNTPADTIVFWTSGMCDPTGVQRVLSLIFGQLNKRAAIYVTSPVDWNWPEFKFTSSLTIARWSEEPNTRVAG